MGRFKSVFTADQEALLVNYITRVDELFYGLDREDLAQLAYEFAEQNKIRHPFKNKQAGEQWLQNFQRRNPDVVLRSPKPTSIARARGFNRHQVELFFDNLKNLIENHKFSSSMIFNVDETGEWLI